MFKTILYCNINISLIVLQQRLFLPFQLLSIQEETSSLFRENAALKQRLSSSQVVDEDVLQSQKEHYEHEINNLKIQLEAMETGKFHSQRACIRNRTVTFARILTSTQTAFKFTFVLLPRTLPRPPIQLLIISITNPTTIPLLSTTHIMNPIPTPTRNLSLPPYSNLHSNPIFQSFP